MRVITQIPEPVKLCHAQPGDVVQFEGGNTFYLVCARGSARPARRNMPHGLYDDQRELFIVNLATGVEANMPHLSSKWIIRDDVAVVTLFQQPKGSQA